ncbi:hypothetical protein PInf_003603 [Phytophthora infestans]|nr:hypothetical protein PInf_003603 [Phytophthora infestans]
MLLGKSYLVWLQYDSDVRNAEETGRKRSNHAASNSEKKRRTTYDVRREQKVELTALAGELGKQLDELKYRVLVEQGEAAKSNKQVAAGNAVLQEFIQQQHLELAKMQAMLAGHCAREVFDAFIDVSQNAEIIISELFGGITIRENNEADNRDISQMRLVTSTTLGNEVESNSVMFAEFVEAKDGQDENCGTLSIRMNFTLTKQRKEFDETRLLSL